MNEPANISERILILTPTGNDAAHAINVLHQAGISGVVCQDCPELEQKFAEGAAALLIAEEALTPDTVGGLLQMLSGQPPWSDVPLLLITSAAETEAAGQTLLNTFAPHGNITLMERPLRPISLVSALRAALRTRLRQYQLRAILEEQKRVDEALRRSHQQLERARDYAEATLRTSPVPLLVLEGDLRVHTANEAFYETFQVKPAETEGQFVYDLGNRQWDIPRLRELLEDILPHHTVLKGFEVTHEFQTIGARTMLLNARRMENEAGGGERVILVIEDVTERKQAEEALRSAHAQLEAELADTKLLQRISSTLIQPHNGEAIYDQVIDAAVAIMRSDYASMQMLYPERGQGGELRLLAFRGFDPQAAQFWEWVGADSESTCGEALRTRQRVITPDVEQCPRMAGTEDLGTYLQTGIHAVQSTPLFSRSGELIGMISTHWKQPRQPSERDLRLLDILGRQAADLIERRRADEALREAHGLLADKAKHLESLVQQRTAKLQVAIGELEAFSYSVAHDVRAPLRAMQGYAEALLRETDLSAESHMRLERIQRAASRLDRLTQEVLSYSQLARAEIKLDPIDLDKLVRDVVEQYPVLGAPECDIDIQSPLLPVLGHEGFLAQALANLMINACKFVAPGAAPEVTVRTEAIAEEVRIWVEDKGIGIEPEHRDRLFKIFGRIHPEKKYEGTGIGLAIVKKAAERMSGTVGFESEMGKGSRFWVQLKKA